MITEGMKILKKDRQLLALKALNFLSPRPSSFTIPTKKERSINLFFRLLDSPNKNTEMSQNNS
jgi:hypothetical protein